MTQKRSLVLMSCIFALLVINFVVVPALRPTTILTLGDSITRGDNPGSKSCPSYRRPLGEMLKSRGANFLYIGSQPGPDGMNEGHPFYTIEDLDENATAYLYPKPDIVLLMAGTNSSKIDTVPQMLEAEKRLLLHILNDVPQAEVYVASPTPFRRGVYLDYSSRIDRFSQLLPDLVREMQSTAPNLHFVDMHDQCGFSSDDWCPDGVHPSGSGNTKMAHVWADALRSEPFSRVRWPF